MERSPNKIHTRETETKKLGYTQDFKDWMREYPQGIKFFKELSQKIYEEPAMSGREFEYEGAEVAVIKDYYWNSDRYLYLKIKFEGEVFFVKSEGIPSRGKGHTEFVNAVEVEEKLKGLKARVIHYQLGYEDSHNRSYFVSKWDENIRDMREVKNSLEDDILRNEALDTSEGYARADEIEKLLESLQNRVSEIRALLPEYHDLTEMNIFYDSTTDEIVLLDLFKTSQNIKETR